MRFKQEARTLVSIDPASPGYEQMKAIQKELGDGEDGSNEYSEIEKKLGVSFQKKVALLRIKEKSKNRSVILN